AEWMGARALRRHPDVAEGDDEPLRGREFIVAPALSVRSSS
ncbi:LacI family transcriptional regulator, partial [Propionibacterium freudenreichii]|nr:LacI family transcriptional regulator [Propionibacterium freudenreichii]